MQADQTSRAIRSACSDGPCIEAVEPRRLLSATLSSGKLTIMGTGGADTITLQLVGGTTLRVVDNGVNRDFTSSAVTSINATLSGGADKFTGTDSITKPMTVTGGDGNDTLTGNAGSDMLWGGNNNDTLDGRSGTDTVSGEAGTDSISGGSGADKLYGGTEADTIWSFRNAGSDNVDNGDYASGGDGNDTINGSKGSDTLFGDNGNDTIDTAKFWDFHATGTDSVEGGANDDTIYANNEINVSTTLKGGSGNDKIYGGNGSDLIYGDTGMDTIEGDGGRDTIHGGDDADTLSVNFVYLPFNSSEIDDVYGDAGDDTISCGPISRGHGGAGNDTLTGRFSTLFGDENDDLLKTTDTGELHGGIGNDDLVLGSDSSGFGDDGDDYIFSDGSGTDTLNGGIGYDRGVNVKRSGSAPLDTYSSIERFLP